jgi:hypothetical protein
MPNPVAVAILAGLISSAMFLSLMTGLPGMVMLAYFVQLPLIFAGLTLGVAGSVIAVASGLLVTGLVAGMVAAAIYTVVQALPAVFVVRQALLAREVEGRIEWYPPGLLLAQLAMIATAGLVLAFMVLLGQPGGFKGTVETFVVGALREFGALEPEVHPSPQFDQMLFLFPGLMGVSWLIMVVLNLVGAQILAIRMQWQRRPSPDFGALELPRWLWPAIALAALVSLVGGEGPGFLARSALLVLLVPHGFLGLAVLHTLARRWSHPGLALVLIYGSILILGWPLLLVVMLGLVEDWAGLRQRLR